MILRWRLQYISLSDRIEPMGSHIKKFYLKFTNWTCEVLIGLRFIKILLGLRIPCSHMVKTNSSLDFDLIKSIALNLT